MEEGKLAGIASIRHIEKEFKDKAGEIIERLNQLKLGSFGIVRKSKTGA